MHLVGEHGQTKTIHKVTLRSILGTETAFIINQQEFECVEQTMHEVL